MVAIPSDAAVAMLFSRTSTKVMFSGGGFSAARVASKKRGSGFDRLKSQEKNVCSKAGNHESPSMVRASDVGALESTAKRRPFVLIIWSRSRVSGFLCSQLLSSRLVSSNAIPFWSARPVTEDQYSSGDTSARSYWGRLSQYR